MILMHDVGFLVMKKTSAELRQGPRALMEQVVGGSGGYAQAPVSCHLELPPGEYSIVPTTFKPGTEGAFIITVWVPTGEFIQAAPDKATATLEDNPDAPQVDTPVVMCAEVDPMSGSEVAVLQAFIRNAEEITWPARDMALEVFDLLDAQKAEKVEGAVLARLMLEFAADKERMQTAPVKDTRLAQMTTRSDIAGWFAELGCRQVTM